MKKILFLLLSFCFSVAAFAQNTEAENLSLINANVRNARNLNPAKIASALDALNYSKAGILQPYTASGTDTYVIASGPAAITAYEAGLWMIVTFTNDNNGASTININSIGAVALTDNTGTALADDAILDGQTKIIFCTSPTQWRVLNDGSGGGGGGGGLELNHKTVSTTTYTVTDADHFYRIYFTHASGCDVTMDDAVSAGTYVVFRSVDGGGNVQAISDGTSVLNADNDDYTIEGPDREASWFKSDATNWDGAGSLGASGAATWGSIGGDPADQADLIALLNAKAPLASPTFTGTPAAPTAAGSTNTTQLATTAFVKTSSPKVYSFAFSDESTTLATGAAKFTFSMPYAMTITNIYCALKTGQTGGSIFTVDINEAGTTILSTKITIDNNETDSFTAATPAVISDTALANRAVITLDIDQVGTGAPVGGKCDIIGY